MKAYVLGLTLLASSPAPARSGVRAAHTSGLVKSVQERLVSRGYAPGYPDGRWSEATTDALQDFQVAHGFTPTGHPDIPTMEALFAPENTPAPEIQRVRGEDPVEAAPRFPRQIFGLGTALGFLAASVLSCLTLWRRRVRA